MNACRMAALFSLWLASPALAQTTVPVPQSSVPTRDQLQVPVPERAPSRARVDARESIDSPACPLLDSPLRVDINRVRFMPVGRPAIPAEIQQLLDQVDLPATGNQPISNVCIIRDRANAQLRRGGYIASVQIPPQEVATGELQLAVVLARISEVRVRGEPGPHRALLERQIARIRALDPLREADIERLLLLTGDAPGLDIQLSLRPAGTGPGEVIGDLLIQSSAFAVYGNVQNYGARQLGRETGYLRGELYGVLTGSDVLYAVASSSLDFDSQQLVQLGYTTGIDGAGTTVGLRGTYAWSRPDLDTLDLRSESLIVGVDVTRPLLRSVRANAAIGLGAEWLDQRTRVFGGPTVSPLNTDKLRIIYARLDSSYRVPDPLGGTLFNLATSVEVRKGVAILGASRPGEIRADGASLSRFEGDPQATVVRGAANAEIAAGPIFSVLGSARGQWANHPLLNLEEFTIGNLAIGRGYDPGSNAGDRAAAVRGEIQARLPLDLPVAIRLLAFADAVWLWNLDSGTTEAERTLTSFGGGVNVQLPGLLSLDILYAVPRDRALSFDPEPPPARLLVSLTARFSPYVR
ncbi:MULTISPECIES: ShlB/FhaC/HecB family hemolysin secretion/activation protein [unclassified Sphingomonas]|uniref:ShlB/FhaC/HecB family hemolysin secretion/activation protein n=2 Tax=unclassified Sphingomonas TaxID=196159 RepID=UPI000B135BA3|nr:MULTISPECIES: ShlB/FhaC/HecB family hemolysin secretion/activation protein [unclassified Sphingomonas]